MKAFLLTCVPAVVCAGSIVYFFDIQGFGAILVGIVCGLTGAYIAEQSGLWE